MYLLDVQPSETFRVAEKLGMRMAIHSPFESTDPFVKGIPLSPGRAYKISIRLVSMELNHTRIYEFKSTSIFKT